MAKVEQAVIDTSKKHGCDTKDFLLDLHKNVFHQNSAYGQLFNGLETRLGVKYFSICI